MGGQKQAKDHLDTDVKATRAKRKEASGTQFEGQEPACQLIEQDTKKTITKLSPLSLSLSGAFPEGTCERRTRITCSRAAELITDPTCRECNEEEETPLHLPCHCEAGKTILGSGEVGQEELRKTTPERILDSIEETGQPEAK